MMAKTPTRLSDFEIPRERSIEQEGRVAEHQGVPQPSTTALPKIVERDRQIAGEPVPVEHVVLTTHPAPKAAAYPTPEAVLAPAVQAEHPTVPLPAPPPMEEPRRQIGARVRLSVAERLRTYLFVSRESQQDAVEAALDAYMLTRGF